MEKGITLYADKIIRDDKLAYIGTDEMEKIG